MAVTGTFGGFYFDPDVFTDYIQEADPVHTSIINSGVLRVAPEISAVLTDKNNVFTVPNYTPLTGDAKNYDGETDNTPVEVAAAKQTGMAFRRMAAWKDQDFTRELTGADPLGDVARKVAYYQQKNNQKDLLSVIDGVLTVDAMSSHVKDITADKGAGTSATPTAENRLSADTFLDAAQEALGDNFDDLTMVAMHSRVYTNLLKLQLVNNIATTPDAYSRGVQFGLLLNKYLVMVDDSLTTGKKDGVATYTTYLLGEGAIATARNVRIDRPNYVDYDPESKGGVNKLYTKWGMAMHPLGMSLDVSKIAKNSPTRVELGTKANWTKVWDAKNIKLAKIVSNG
jgi:hypothetical protein